MTCAGYHRRAHGSCFASTPTARASSWTSRPANRLRDRSPHRFNHEEALVLFSAHAAGVAAIETVYPDLKDAEGLKAYAIRARRDGFSGMLAIHPAQLAIIHAAFTPSQDEIAWARRVVDAFAANPERGALQIGDKMVDAPHLKQAHRILAATI